MARIDNTFGNRQCLLHCFRGTLNLSTPRAPRVAFAEAAQYLPFLVSCCRMFLIKWTFLKFFGLGDPERVRHLKNKLVGEKKKKKKRAEFPAVQLRSLHKGRKERLDK